MTDESEFGSVDWAAFDAAQAPDDRSHLLEIYPEYKRWYEGRGGEPAVGEPAVDEPSDGRASEDLEPPDPGDLDERGPLAEIERTTDEGEAGSIDWAAFDAAQAPDDRPRLLEIYPEYRRWCEGRAGEPVVHQASDGRASEEDLVLLEDPVSPEPPGDAPSDRTPVDAEQPQERYEEPTEPVEVPPDVQRPEKPEPKTAEIYRGHPSPWAGVGWYIAGVLTIWIYGLGLIFILAGYLTVINRFWTITTSEVTLRTGILSRTEKTIPMWRVRDVGFHQGALGRALGVGAILLATSDSSDPVFVIKGLRDAEAVYRSLKDCLLHTKGSMPPIER